MRLMNRLHCVCLAAVALVSGSVLAAQEKTDKLPVPEKAAQKEAMKLIKEIYKQDYDKAKSTSEKFALAKKMLREGVATKDDATGRYVLLRVSREIAAKAGIVKTAFHAIDQIDKYYEIDALKMKIEALSKAAGAAKTLSQHKTVAQTALKLFKQAAAENKIDALDELSKLALDAAKKSKDRVLIKQILALKKRFEEIAKAYKDAEKANAILENDPTNAEANETVGRYWAIYRGNWEKGLPMLALGKDETLKNLARKELDPPSKTTGQMALADGWWNLAEGQKEEGKYKIHYQLRAGYWYRKAISKLVGLAKAKAQKRLSQLPDAPETPAEQPSLDSWPSNDRGLVLAWQRGDGGKLTSEARQLSSRWRLELKGAATFSKKDGSMLLAKGGVLVHGPEQLLLKACQKSNQLSVEVVLVTANTKQGGPARIVTFSSGGHSRNFTLGQQNDNLIFRLRTPNTGKNGSSPETTLCPVVAGQPVHVIVSYREGQMVCYLNGRSVLQSTKVRGNFSNWDSSQHILFGDEWRDPRDWFGGLERVAIYNRIITPDEARKNFESVSASLKK